MVCSTPDRGWTAAYSCRSERGNFSAQNIEFYACICYDFFETNVWVKEEKNMQITEVRDNDVIIISIEGRVDTNTSPQLQEAILKGFQKVNRIVLDFEKCAYVSSAGLRALLIGQKTANSKKGTMKLVHVPAILMSVLEVSGFINILTIE